MLVGRRSARAEQAAGALLIPADPASWLALRSGSAPRGAPVILRHGTRQEGGRMSGTFSAARAAAPCPHRPPSELLASGDNTGSGA